MSWRMLKQLQITNAPTDNTLEVYNTFEFTCTQAAENGGESTDKIEWSVSDANIGMIDENGTFTALSPGEVSVYAKTYQSKATKDLGYTAESQPVTITVVENPNILYGLATIEGSPYFGEILTVNIPAAAIADFGEVFNYQWKSSGNNAGNNQNTYQLTKDDIGKNIICEITCPTNENIKIIAALASTVSKADNPVAPTNLGGIAPTTADDGGKIIGTDITMEYCTDNDFTSPTDCSDTETEVAPGTYYVRYVETDTHFAGECTEVVVPDYVPDEPIYIVPITQKYTLTVTNGTGSGSYEVGAVVNISANLFLEGKQFLNWTSSDGGSFGDADSASTTFTMPANATTIVANYKDLPFTVYAVTSGSKQLVTIGTAIEFVSEASFDKFIKVQIDGIDIQKDYYTVEQGSTIITLKPEYTQTLTAGAHSISIVSADGIASTGFTVSETTEAETASEANSDVDSETESESNSGIESEVTPEAVPETESETTSESDSEESNGIITGNNSDTGNNNSADSDVPRTGDNSNLFLWIILMFIACAGIAVTLIFSKKMKKLNK